MTTLKSTRAEQTESLGRRIGLAVLGIAGDGAVISMEGPLGAGKTVLVKGIARSLGIEEEITSPTFTLISHYRGRGRPAPDSGGIDLYHVDLYRIDREEEIEDLGLEDLMRPGAVVVIEWGEKAAGFLPEDTVRVRIRIAPHGERTIELQGLAP